MFGYVSSNVKYYILSQIFYKKNPGEYVGYIYINEICRSLKKLKRLQMIASMNLKN